MTSPIESDLEIAKRFVGFGFAAAKFSSKPHRSDLLDLPDAQIVPPVLSRSFL
jgi:hypothetical protein